MRAPRKALEDIPPALRDDVTGFLDRKADATRLAYLRDLWAFFAATGIETLEQVTFLELVRYDAACVDAGAAPATIRRRLHVLKGFLSFCYDAGKLDRNVGRAKRVPKAVPIGRDRALAEVQVWTMFAGCSERDRLVCRTLYYSGARVAELAGLRWRDIADDGKGHGMLRFFGKGSKIREVLVPAFMFAELVRARGAAADEQSVFNLTDRQLRRIVVAAGRRARIPGSISPHWLRHAHGSHANEHGAPIAIIAATLGHESPTTTLGYLHPKPGDGSGLYLRGF